MHEPAFFSRRAVAALPIAALAGAAPAAAPTLSAAIEAGADAVLLDLGRRWAAAVAAVIAHDGAYSQSVSQAAYAEHEAVADRLFEAEQDLLLSIISTPAHTVQGMAVKAEALARELDVRGRGVEAVQAALSHPQDHETRVALSLVLDVLKIARFA